MSVKKKYCAVLCLLFALTTPRAPAQQKTAWSTPPARPETFDTQSFVVELERLDQLSEALSTNAEFEQLAESLPEHWIVQDGQTSYTIPTARLQNYLKAHSTADARDWLHTVSRQAEASRREGVETSRASAELQGILARPEFSRARTETLMSRAQAAIGRLLGKLFERLFYEIDQHPVGGRVLFWMLIVAGVSVAAMWIFRFLASQDRFSSMPVTENVVAVRSWQEWIHGARDAAKRGNFREAIHHAYWAGIVRLQDADVLPKDRAKTPREYLRYLSHPDGSGQMANPAYRQSLMALTQRLERTWYASQSANLEEFEESLKQLEALGCRLE